ncbi:Uncharacterised protein [[Eubacterium] contortum]|uniref:Uncharacterized protein n=2 Tax=Bacillota TaxID=1239 RepID=A0A173ZLN9_9FIRM|nr:Uncharacterised protein [[Eubacterium] contortum] [Faecalicatena contorta]
MENFIFMEVLTDTYFRWGRAVFRYVKSEKEWTEVELTCVGSGTVTILMNGKNAGIVSVSENGKEEVSSAIVTAAPIRMSAGVYELCLRFENPEKLEILSIRLK